MSKKARLFFCILLLASFSLWAQTDEYIFFTIPGNPVCSVTLTVTMAGGESPSAFHIIDPAQTSTTPVNGSQPAGNQILSGNTFYYPYTATTPPHTKATFTRAGSVLTLTIERWNDITDRGYLAQGTWVFIVRNLNNPTTKSFTCLDIDGNPIGTCASLNSPPAMGIGFNPVKAPMKAPSFGSTYCFVTGGAAQNIRFVGSAVDAEGNALSGYRWESTHRVPAQFSTNQDTGNISFDTDNVNAYDITFFVTESFTGTSFTRVSTTQATVVVKNPPITAIQYNTDGGAVYNDLPAGTLGVQRGATLYLSGQNSQANDPLSGGLLYAWDFDGDGEADADTVLSSRQYSVNGFYGVRLKITDAYLSTDEKAVNIYVSESGLEEPVFPVPDLISPADGAEDVSVDIDLKWELIEDGNTGPVTYKLYISPDSEFTGCTPIISALKADGFFFACVLGMAGFLPLAFFTFKPGRARKRLAFRLLIVLYIFLLLVSCAMESGKGGKGYGLAAHTTYYWKVRAENTHGANSESVVWSFTTK